MERRRLPPDRLDAVEPRTAAVSPQPAADQSGRVCLETWCPASSGRLSGGTGFFCPHHAAGLHACGARGGFGNAETGMRGFTVGSVREEDSACRVGMDRDSERAPPSPTRVKP